MFYATKRQQLLAEQGYSFMVAMDVEESPLVEQALIAAAAEGEEGERRRRRGRKEKEKERK